MSIPKPAPQKATWEPSHHEFEIEQPHEELVDGRQMTGSQGLHFHDQQQEQMETLPRDGGIIGLEPEKRQKLAEEFNLKASSRSEARSQDPDR